jgi:hypothetical protein
MDGRLAEKNHRWATGVAFFLADEHGKRSVHPHRGHEIRALRELQRQFPGSKHVFATERMAVTEFTDISRFGPVLESNFAAFPGSAR